MAQSRNDEEAALSAAEAYEYASGEEDESGDHTPNPLSPTTRLLGPAEVGAGGSTGNGGPPRHFTSRSHYHVSHGERLRGVANRIIFSRYYVLFYFVMMCLSLGTVVLSLVATHKKQCPPVIWHILEVIVNGLMVIEVSTRWVAYGKKYPMTPLNIIDLLLVLFCSITLILVFRSPCAEGARQEEVLDTILLVIRNAVQFLRLGNILRRSGHSLLNPPKPIDLSNARTASLALDLDLDMSDDEAVAERRLADTSPNAANRRTLVGRSTRPSATGNYAPIFHDDEDEARGGQGNGAGVDTRPVRKPLDVGGDRGRQGLNVEDEEMWDRLG
ncbi:hypothetical protein DB88DRAFT_513455 [Papiliotrema laurentii]|uniref:Ion transport domain-containing protein n=1 Tax=Papiliotrema laurentii TaxID=5418 RepID=A0AAD9CV50_PAPLA|nr:hypothetical protein DB88DRAFT_513455 [Papiliotrema laurentii]